MFIKRLILVAGILANLGSWAYAAEMDEARVFEEAAPAVVVIAAYGDRGQSEKGTGSIIRKDGLILTNAHVVLDNAQQIYTHFAIGLYDKNNASRLSMAAKGVLQAKVVGLNEEMDLALLQLKGHAEDLPTLQFANSNSVRVGDPVVAIGHPEKGALWTLTSGSISAPINDFKGRKGWDVFQTETSINRGNSGGPLINQHGHIVGINVGTNRVADDKFPITDINFAIQSKVAKNWLDKKGISLAYATPPPEPETGPTQVSEEIRPKEETFEDKAGSLMDLMNQKREKVRRAR